MVFRLGYMPEEYSRYNNCHPFHTLDDVRKCSEYLANEIKCTFASEIEFYPFDYYDSYSNHVNATFSSFDNESVLGALGLNLIDAYFDDYADMFSGYDNYVQFTNAHTDTEVCLYTHKEIAWHAKSLWSFVEPLTSFAMIATLCGQIVVTLIHLFLLRHTSKTFLYFRFPYSMTGHLQISFVIALWSILTKVNYADKQVHHRKFKTIEELNKKILSGDLQFMDESFTNLSAYFMDVLSEVDYRTLSPALSAKPAILAKDVYEICHELKHNNSIVHMQYKLNMRVYCEEYFKYADEMCLHDGSPQFLVYVFGKESKYAEPYNQCVQLLNAEHIRIHRQAAADEELYSKEGHGIRVPLIQGIHVVMPMGMWFLCLIGAFLCFCVEKALATVPDGYKSGFLTCIKIAVSHS